MNIKTGYPVDEDAKIMALAKTQDKNEIKKELFYSKIRYDGRVRFLEL